MPIKSFIVYRLLLLVIFSLGLLTTYGQLSLVRSISPLEQAQNDYSFQLTKLSDAYEKFITAKSNYLSYKTAVSKNEAFSKTKDYFLQTHYVYLSYLFLIEERTNIFDWSLSTYKKDDTHLELKKETDYLDSSLERAKNVQTLEEIQSNSKSLEDHIITSTLPAVVKTLTISDIAQIEDSLSSYNLLSQKIDNIVKDKVNDTNRPLYQNWKSEIENVKNQLDLQIKDSKKTLGQAQVFVFTKTNQLLTKTFIETSLGLLDRAKNLLSEILNNI